MDFPTTGLDMAPFVAEGSPHRREQNVFDLFAVSNHTGGLGGGHYTCCALHAPSGQWCDFDDSRCCPVRDGSVVSPAANVLFYRRR